MTNETTMAGSQGKTRTRTPDGAPLRPRDGIRYHGRLRFIGDVLAENGIKWSTYTERRRRGWGRWLALTQPTIGRP